MISCRASSECDRARCRLTFITGDYIDPFPDYASRRDIDLREQYGDSLDRFTFDERRLALRALGFRAHANGDDPARWRYEAGTPAARTARTTHDA